MKRTGPMKLRTSAAAAIAGALLAAAIPNGRAAAIRTQSGPRFSTLEEAVAAGVVPSGTVADLRSGRPVRVLVNLPATVGQAAVASASAPGASTLATLHASISRAKLPVFLGMGTATRHIRDYANLPAFSASVQSPDDLLRIANTAGVERIAENESFQATLDSSLPAIGQPAAVASGYSGAGTYVGVIDSGVDYTRAAFGPCTSPGVPASCRVAELPPDFTTDQNFQPYSDGYLDDPLAPPPSAPLSAALHGTNVSGIVAGTAPAAKLIVADVFECFFPSTFVPVQCSPAATAAGAVSSAFTEDIVAAVDYMIGRKVAGVNIVAVNLSLGGSARFTSPCTDTFHFAQLIAAGIQPIVAAGNAADDVNTGAYLGDGVSSPACISGAIPVGALFDNGAQPTFSQSGPFPNMIWAPGVSITAALVTKSGTSMAAPHVAGAFAAVSQARPGMVLAARHQVLLDSATTFTNGWPATGARLERYLNMGRMAQFLTVPPNDNRANASTVNAGFYGVNAYSATTEAGEPLHNGTLSRTVWYRTTLTRSGVLRVESPSSAVGMYPIAPGPSFTRPCPSSAFPPGCVEFVGAVGQVVEFALSAPVAPNYFHSFTVSSSNYFSNDEYLTPAALAGPTTVNLAYANASLPEPAAPGVTASRTLYYTYTASTPTTITVTPGADVAVFDGLNPLSSNVIARTGTSGATAGPFTGTVLIQVGSAFPMLVTISPGPGAPSNNDDAATPIALSGAFGATSNTTVTATPTVGGPFDRDLWYRYTAAASGRLFVNTIGSNVDTELCATSGPTTDCIGDETPAGPGASTVVVNVQPGQVVDIRAGIPTGGVPQGTINLSFRLVPDARTGAPGAPGVAAPRSPAPTGGPGAGGARSGAPRAPGSP